MNHIDPVGAGLGSTPGFGVMQVFPDFPDFSGTVVDDFRTSASTAVKVSAAFETSGSNFFFENIQGWRVSFWTSVQDASNSGTSLDQRTVWTGLVNSPSRIAYTLLSGTGAAGTAYKVDLDLVGLGAVLGGGKVLYLGVAVVANSSAGQAFILRHTSPSVLGNGTADNSWGVNPGLAFGLSNPFFVATNAAYRVETVPEPWLLGLCAVLLAGVRRRRP